MNKKTLAAVKGSDESKSADKGKFKSKLAGHGLAGLKALVHKTKEKLRMVKDGLRYSMLTNDRCCLQR
jgi:hypothetical protein